MLLNCAIVQKEMGHKGKQINIVVATVGEKDRLNLEQVNIIIKPIALTKVSQEEYVVFV